MEFKESLFQFKFYYYYSYNFFLFFVSTEIQDWCWCMESRGSLHRLDAQSTITQVHITGTSNWNVQSSGKLIHMWVTYIILYPYRHNDRRHGQWSTVLKFSDFREVNQIFIWTYESMHWYDDRRISWIFMNRIDTGNRIWCHWGFTDILWKCFIRRQGDTLIEVLSDSWSPHFKETITTSPLKIYLKYYRCFLISLKYIAI